MRVLLDACVPRPLRRFLPQHEVKVAQEMGWSELKNGDLLRAAELQFDVFITSDQNLKHQQNLQNRRIAIVVLPTNDWTVLRAMTDAVAAALATIQPGAFVEVPRK